MDKRIPWDIIIKKFKEEISSDEQTSLNLWLAEEKNRSVYNELETLWMSIIQDGLNYKSDADALWVKMERRMKKSQPRTIQFSLTNFRWLSGVASLLLIILLSTTGYMASEYFQANTIVQTYSSLGGKSKVILPDGTYVWLNAESTLEYTATAWSKTRNVKLNGEAYFEVKKDPKRPFIVKSGGLDVKVHGTAFNVEARNNKPDVSVSLLSGSVSVKSATMTKEIIPGEEAVYSKKDGNIEIGKSDVAFAAMWANETIHFERKSIKELTKFLSKWYGVKIILDPSIPENQAYTFSVKNEPLEEILRLMARANPIRYSFDEKNIVRIKRK